MNPTIGILALQGAFRAHELSVRRLGADTLQVRTPDDLDRVDALVMPGGESTTMSKLLGTSGLFDPIAARIAAGMPVFGTCAGMILLADRIEGGTADQETIGGLDVTVRRNAFGRQVDSFEADLSFAGLADPVHAVFIRAPWVEATGAGVEVLAEAQGHPVAVRQGHLMATSFHPEVDGDGRVHRVFLDLVAG